MNSRIVQQIATNHDNCIYSLIGNTQKYSPHNPFSLVQDTLINVIAERYLSEVILNKELFDFIMIQSPEDVALCQLAAQGQYQATFLKKETEVIHDLTTLELLTPALDVAQTAQAVLDLTKKPLIFPMVKGGHRYKVRMITSPRLLTIVSSSPTIYQVNVVGLMILAIGYLRVMHQLSQSQNLTKHHFESHPLLAQCRKLSIWVEGYFATNYINREHLAINDSILNAVHYYRHHGHMRTELYNTFLNVN